MGGLPSSNGFRLYRRGVLPTPCVGVAQLLQGPLREELHRLLELVDHADAGDGMRHAANGVDRWVVAQAAPERAWGHCRVDFGPLAILRAAWAGFVLAFFTAHRSPSSVPTPRASFRMRRRFSYSGTANRTQSR